MGIGQIRRQYDAGVDARELGFVEHASERGDGEGKVAVLLHVEVDECCRCFRLGQTVEASKRHTYCVNRGVERQRADMCAYCRDLDGDVVHVGSQQRLADQLQTVLGLVLAEDRFAEDVHIGARPIGTSPGEMAGDARLAIEHDCPLGLIAQAPQDQRDDDAGKNRSDLRSDADEQPIEKAERTRVGRRDESGEATGRPAGIVESGDLVGEDAGEPGKVVAYDDGVEAVASGNVASTLPGFDCQGTREQIGGPHNRPIGLVGLVGDHR